MWGDSYGAWTQWKVAIDGVDKPDAIFPSGLPMSALDSPVLRPARRILWYVGRMGPDSRRRSDRRVRTLDERSAYRELANGRKKPLAVVPPMERNAGLCAWWTFTALPEPAWKQAK